MTRAEQSGGDGTRDCGTAGVEVAISVTALLLMVMFVVGALRITNADGDVAAAARAGARAAATARTVDGGRSAAHAVVAAALADRGVACAGGPAVEVARTTGSVATVTVRCAVVLDDVAAAGFSSKTLVASASERVDPLRGGG